MSECFTVVVAFCVFMHLRSFLGKEGGKDTCRGRVRSLEVAPGRKGILNAEFSL